MKVWWVVLLAGLISGCCLLDGFAGPTAKEVPSDDLFTSTVVDPMPDEVESLEATGDLWQGYSLWFRFRADARFVDDNLEGYDQVTCDALYERQFVLPNREYDTFSPPWGDTFGDLETCYEKHGVSNGWTGSGSHRIARGRDGRWYVRAIGS